MNGSKRGNFYRNGIDGVMYFDTTVIQYIGDDSWVAGAVESAVKCLHSGSLPDSGADCDDCRYFESRKIIEKVNNF